MATFDEILAQLKASPEQLDLLRQHYSGEEEKAPEPTPSVMPEPSASIDSVIPPKPQQNIFQMLGSTVKQMPQQGMLKTQDEYMPPADDEGPSSKPMSETDRVNHVEDFKARRLAAIQNAPETATVPGSKPLSVLDFGQNNLANQAGLEAAQGRQKDLEFLANMNRAAGQIGAGIAQSGKPDTSIADSVEKQGKQEVDNYKEKIDFQKQDPNSGYSKGLKDYFKTKLGIEIKGDASAVELEKIMPLAVREYEANLERARLKEKADEDRAARKELYGLKSEKEEGKAEVKATDKANNDFMKMAEKLSGAKASSRSAFGKAALNKAAAERLETLVEGRDLNSLDAREMQEVARSLDALLAQGQPTISGTHELVPKTARGDTAKLLEYITNQRQGANGASFLKQMIKTVGREKELAQKQMDSYKKELVPGYEHLEKQDPERFNRILKGGSSEESPSVPSPETKEPASLESAPAKQVVKKGYNPKTNQTQLIYSDGTKEIVDGQR